MRPVRSLLALTALAALSTPALAAPVVLVATLGGANGGDADGTGSFTVEVEADAGDFCYSLKATNVDKPTMAHVHEGAEGANGPPVITLEMAEDLCIAVEPAKLAPILANPAGFYVNVHTAAHPGGAIRGQLAKK